MDSRFRWRKLMAITLVAIVVVFVGLYLYRLRLAETLVANLLATRGLDADVRVTRLDAGRVRFEDVRLEDLTADAIDVRWRWTPVSGLTLTRVEVEDPSVRVDLTSGRVPFAALRHAFGNSGDTGTSVPSSFDPPALAVRNGTARLATPGGNLDLSFSVDTRFEAPAGRTYALTLTAEGPQLSASGDGRLDWRDGAPVTASASIETTDTRNALRSTARLSLRWQPDRLAAELAAAGKIPASLPAKFGLAQDRLAGLVDGAAEGTMSWGIGDGEILPARAPDVASFGFRLAGADLAWPGAVADGSLHWSGEIEYERDQDLLVLRPSSELALEASFPDWQRHLPALAEVTVPGAIEHVTLNLETVSLRIQPITGLLSTDNVRMTITGSDGSQLHTEGPWQVRLPPGPSVTTRQDVTLKLPGVLRDIRDVKGDAALALAGGPDHLTLTLAGPATLSATPSAGQAAPAASWLGGRTVTVHTEARSASGPPCLTLTKQGDDMRADLDCRVMAQSRELGNTEIGLAGMLGRSGQEGLDLDISELSLRSAGLRTPYGLVEQASAHGSLEFRSGRLETQLALEAEARALRIPGASVDDGRIVLQGDLAGPPDALRLTLESATIEAGAISLGTAGIDVAPVSVTMESTDLGLQSGIVTGEARVTSAQTTVHTGDASLAVGPVRMTLSSVPTGHPSARLSVERIEDLALGLGMYSLKIAANQRGPNRYDAELLQSTVRDLMLPRRLPPSKWSGKLVAEEGRLQGRFEASPEAAPQVTLTLTGRYNTADGRGHVDTSLDGMVFGPGLQPKMLWPAAVLERVAGRLDFGGQADFGPSGLVSSGGQLNLDLASFESEGTRVTGLALPLNLSSLWPLESPPDQRLTIDRVGDGTGASDLELVYRLAPTRDGIPVLEIDHGGFATLGGRVRIAPARLDPRQTVQSLVLQAERLDLVSVLSLITSEGIGGEGSLSGRFPIRFEDDDLVIEGAVLESEAPGRLAFSSAAADQTLESGGQHMALLLQALENFHYERLSLTVDKAAGGDAHLQLALRGHNPDVLDGYPFAINIDLQTNVAPFLSVLRQGNDMVDEVVKRIWRP